MRYIGLLSMTVNLANESNSMSDDLKGNRNDFDYWVYCNKCFYEEKLQKRIEAATR